MRIAFPKPSIITARRRSVIESPYSPERLLDLLRSYGKQKDETELPAALQAIGVRAATFRVGNDGSFRIVMDGVRANGITGADIEGRGHIAAKREGGGADVVLVVTAGSLTKWQVVSVLAFCFGSDVIFRSSKSISLGSLTVTVAGAIFLLSFLWFEVNRLSDQVRPGLVQLVEGIAAGRGRISSDFTSPLHPSK